MIVKRLELTDYRNYESLEIEFADGSNILYGNNAQGKTNILESVYLSGTTKSHRGSKADEMIRLSSNEAHIRVYIVRDGIDHKIDYHLVRGGKKKNIAIDGVAVKKYSEIFSLMSVVSFSPEDLSIVKNGPAERRNFMDRELCQLDKIYLFHLSNYNKALTQRNALLRQMALITLLAQMGSFVPAESARIGYVDKIFTRVGASDNISIGESTFMVEMNEAAGILNNLSERSLVLFDELGRGTSTYDGISIAWAIVEYIHENNRGHARTLFATHYHELNEMERNFARIKNFNVSVKEVDGKVIFLRKLERGGSEHSFGIHVAKLAGMPRAIVARANVILKELEGAVNHQNLGARSKEQGARDSGVQMNFFQLDDPVLCQIRDEILGLDINNLTPFEALSKLNDIKKLVKGSN